MLNNKNKLTEASKLIIWNRRILSLLGLWPDSRSNILFAICFLYYLYQVVMCYVTFYLSLGRLLLAVKVAIEVLTYSHVNLRILLLCKNNNIFGILFEEFKKDFEEKNFKSEDEMKKFLDYNRLAKSLIKVLLTFPTLVSTLYYFKPILLRYLAIRAMRAANKTMTIRYLLPYSSYSLLKMTNFQSYIIVYSSQFPLAILSGIIQSAADCLALTLGCHLCGKLAALAHRIRNMNVKNIEDYQTVIRIHQKILRNGKMIEESLSGLLFYHLFIASILICVVIFQILIYNRPGTRIHLITIFTLLSVNILRLYSHCWVGEYIVHESNAVHEAFYDCEWYNMSLNNRKHVIFHLMRSQYPLRFEAGGFGTFSITTFTEVMKTATAYLSFLRNFI